MATKAKQVIAMLAPVEIAAAKEGDSSPPRFSMTAYTGGELVLPNFELPVVVDLEGATFHKSVKANLNHDRTQMVGHVDQHVNDGRSIHLAGAISGGGAAAEQVLKAHSKGYPWEASIQANRLKVETLQRGKTAIVNGQEVVGPKYIARQSTIYAVAFCDQGADDSTEVHIAASAASTKGNAMLTEEIKAWAEGMGIDVDNATPEALATIKANYEGKVVKAEPKKPANAIEARKAEAARRREINAIADQWAAKREDDYDYIESVEKLRDHAIEAKMTVQEFRNELYESEYPVSRAPAVQIRDRGLNGRILEAALCQTGRLSYIDDAGFSDQELQAARDHFKDGISLNQFLILGAEANGYRGTSGGKMNLDIQRAAFGMTAPGYSSREIKAFGFSGIDVANIVAATANKFLHEGWMHVDMTPLRIAAIRSVRNFQQITTVSLTGHLQYEKVGPAGEIKDGVLDDLTYTNQVDTYGLKLGITRQDLINDDLSALTAVPRRLGRGGALKLNDIFWTEFLGLVSSNFFASGNSNINTGVADMTVGGLDATETIFMNQTDPDGKPVGFTPKILLVPTALKNKAAVLMGSMGSGVAITGYATATGDANPFVGRFRVESSPYISNSSYTGNTAVAWWMLADPNDAAVIEIAALNGKVEPTIETVNAPFGYLGIGMQGYSDIGVNEQEKRAGVHADGGAS